MQALSVQPLADRAPRWLLRWGLGSALLLFSPASQAAPAPVQVEVTDLAGRPVPGVALGAGYATPLEQAVHTDERGRAALPGQAWMVDPAYVEVTWERVQVDAPTSSERAGPVLSTVIFRVAARCAVTVALRDPSGQPLVGVDLQVTAAGSLAGARTDDAGSATFEAWEGLVRLHGSRDREWGSAEAPLRCGASTPVALALEPLAAPLPSRPTEARSRRVRLADPCFADLASELDLVWRSPAETSERWSRRLEPSCARKPSGWVCHVPRSDSEILLEEPPSGCLTPPPPVTRQVGLPSVPVPAGARRLGKDACPSGGQLLARWGGDQPVSVTLVGDGPIGVPLDLDPSGQIALTWVAPGRYDLVARRLGEVSALQEVIIQPDQRAEVTLTPDTGEALGRLPPGVDSAFARLGLSPAGVLQVTPDGEVRVRGLPPDRAMTMCLLTAEGAYLAEVQPQASFGWRAATPADEDALWACRL